MLEAVTSAAAALAVGGCCTWRLASFLQLSILMAAAVAPTTSVLRAASVAGSWQVNTCRPWIRKARLRR